MTFVFVNPTNSDYVVRFEQTEEGYIVRSSVFTDDNKEVEVSISLEYGDSLMRFYRNNDFDEYIEDECPEFEEVIDDYNHNPQPKEDPFVTSWNKFIDQMYKY